MNPAVIVIDMQKKVYETIPSPFEAEAVIERINTVCSRARAQGIPVIFSQHQAEGFLEQGSDGWQLVTGLLTGSADIFLQKTAGDAFTNTALQQILEEKGVDHLIIMGFASEICVDSTTRRAAALGYSIQLVADAHTTHEKAHLSAAKIREHHNLTLSLSPMIEMPQHGQLRFQ